MRGKCRNEMGVECNRVPCVQVGRSTFQVTSGLQVLDGLPMST